MLWVHHVFVTCGSAALLSTCLVWTYFLYFFKATVCIGAGKEINIRALLPVSLFNMQHVKTFLVVLVGALLQYIISNLFLV